MIVTMGCGDECPYIPGKRYIDPGQAAEIIAAVMNPGSASPMIPSTHAPGWSNWLRLFIAAGENKDQLLKQYKDEFDQIVRSVKFTN